MNTGKACLWRSPRSPSLVDVARPSRYVWLMKVREVLTLLEADGWFLVRTKGSHRQFKHPEKNGTVTVQTHYVRRSSKG